MAKIVVDAGHGGVDSGAVGNGIVEKNLTLLKSAIFLSNGKWLYPEWFSV